MIEIHEISEELHTSVGNAVCAIVLARSSAGVLLVFNRYRKCWELPGGYCEPGESLRACAVREFFEETGQQCAALAWLALVSFSHRGGKRFGGLYRTTLEQAAPPHSNEEIGALCHWPGGAFPDDMSPMDARLLDRFA